MIYTHCIECDQEFKLDVNVFTIAGHRETQISGLCECCFDELFWNDDSA